MSTDDSRLKFVEARGSAHDIGVQLGRFGAGIAHAYLVQSPSWHSVMAFREDERVREMRRLVEQRLPAIWQELQGLAQGLDLPFDDVFLWNCRGDVWAMAPDGCTTVLLPGGEPIVAHNEDGDPGFQGHCALAHVRPEAGRAFTSFVYPASIPGHTFAVTETGLVQTVNNIRARGAGAGLPRMVLGRAVLNAATLDEALRLIEAAPRAGAFHFTLGQRGDSRLFSVEFSHKRASIEQAEQPRCHANHFVHEPNAGEAQIITGSSDARQGRGDALLRETAEPLKILWDKENAALPIAREQPDDPDAENTMATAIVRIGAKAVEWEVYDRPGTTAPAYRLRDLRRI